VSEAVFGGPAFAPAFFARVAYDIFASSGGGWSSLEEWDNPRNIIRFLGATITVDQFKSLPEEERKELKRAAKALYLREVVKRLPRGSSNRGLFQLGYSQETIDWFRKWVDQGKLYPLPDLARVAAILARFAPVISPAEVARGTRTSREREVSEPSVLRRRAQQPAPQVPPDASTAGDIGASVRSVYQTARSLRELRKMGRDLQRAQRAQRRRPPVALSDTLNTILGVGERAYGIYGGIQMARYNAQAAATTARAQAAQAAAILPAQLPAYATPYQAAGFAPTNGAMTTTAGISPSILAAIQAMLAGGAVGAGAGALANLAAAPPMLPAGGGGAMILRPGDSVDALYAQRMASAAPSFFATQDASGRLKWYRAAGRPILWSGDLAAARRVNRVASRAARRLGRGRALRRRR